jgi:CheY-like chemotaxis protein
MKDARSVVAIVNDEAVFVHLLDSVLRDEGWDTLLLQAGEVAYASIKQQPPHAILLDINSDAPQTSWQFVDLLLLDPQTASIPLIICDVAILDMQMETRDAGLRVLKHLRQYPEPHGYRCSSVRRMRSFLNQKRRILSATMESSSISRLIYRTF